MRNAVPNPPASTAAQQAISPRGHERHAGGRYQHCEGSDGGGTRAGDTYVVLQSGLQRDENGVFGQLGHRREVVGPLGLKAVRRFLRRWNLHGRVMHGRSMCGKRDKHKQGLVVVEGSATTTNRVGGG